MTDVRVIHDGSFMNVGGSSRVAREIAKALDAEITVGHSINPEFWAEVDPDFPFREEINEGVSGWLYDKVIPKPYAALRVSQKFKSLDFEEAVLITTSDVSKWIVPKYYQTHIHYCHVPPEHYYARTRDSFFGWVKQTGMGVVDRYFTSFCDGILANSEFTRQRVQKHYRRDATVLNPPVRTSSFYHEESEGYFMMIGRLVAMKRAKMVAEVFEDLDRELVVVGEGPQRAAIERTGATVHPNPSDEEVEDLVARAEAGVAFADHEHCGLTPKEFQAAGKPVIVPNEPNLNNHVEHGVSGVVVEPTPEGLAAGVEEILATEWDPDRIRAETDGWSVEEFHRRCREYVQEVSDA